MRIIEKNEIWSFMRNERTKTLCFLDKCIVHFVLASLDFVYIQNTDCRSRINPPCVTNNINHIRFITYKWDWLTFHLKSFLEFSTTLSFFISFTKNTWIPSDSNFHLLTVFTFLFLLCLVIILFLLLSIIYSPNSVDSLLSS